MQTQRDHIIQCLNSAMKYAAKRLNRDVQYIKDEGADVAANIGNITVKASLTDIAGNRSYEEVPSYITIDVRQMFSTGDMTRTGRLSVLETMHTKDGAVSYLTEAITATIRG